MMLMLLILTVRQPDGSYLVSRDQFHSIVKQVLDWKVCVGCFSARILYI